MLDLFVVPTLVATLVLVVGLIGWWLAVEWAFRPKESEKHVVNNSSTAKVKAPFHDPIDHPKRNANKPTSLPPTSLPPTSLPTRSRVEEQTTAAADLGLKRTAEKIAAPAASDQTITNKHHTAQKQNLNGQTAPRPTRYTEKPAPTGFVAHNAGSSDDRQGSSQSREAQASAKHQSQALKTPKPTNQKQANSDRSTSGTNTNVSTSANAAVVATRKETRPATPTVTLSQTHTRPTATARIPELAATETTDDHAPQRLEQNKAAAVTQKLSTEKDNNKKQQKQKYQTAAKSNRASIRHEASLQITDPSIRPATDTSKSSTEKHETAKKDDFLQKLSNQPTNKVVQANAATSPETKKDEAHNTRSDKLNKASTINTAKLTPGKSSTNQSDVATALTEKKPISHGNTATTAADKDFSNQSNPVNALTDKGPINQGNTATTATVKSSTNQSNTANTLTNNNPTNQGSTATTATDKNSSNQSNTANTLTNNNPTNQGNTTTTATDKNSSNQSNTANTLTNNNLTSQGNTTTTATDKSSTNQSNTAPTSGDKSSTNQSNAATTSANQNPIRQSNTAAASTDNTPTNQSNTAQNAVPNSVEKNPTSTPTQHKGATNVHALSDASQRKNISLVNTNPLDQNAANKTRKQSAIELAVARKEATTPDARPQYPKQQPDNQTSTDNLHRDPAIASATEEPSQAADPDLRAELELSKKRIASLQSALNNAQQNQQTPLPTDTPASASKTPPRATLLSKVRVLDSTKV